MLPKNIKVEITKITVHQRGIPERGQRWMRDRSWQRDMNEYQELPRIYLSEENSGPVQEIMNGERYNKPYHEIRKFHIKEILTKANIPLDAKIRWNKHAGCKMCPCSPGFIVDWNECKTDDIPKNRFFDVWVHYKYVNAQNETVHRKIIPQVVDQLKAQAII